MNVKTPGNTQPCVPPLGYPGGCATAGSAPIVLNDGSDCGSCPSPPPSGPCSPVPVSITGATGLKAVTSLDQPGIPDSR